MDHEIKNYNKNNITNSIIFEKYPGGFKSIIPKLKLLLTHLKFPEADFFLHIHLKLMKRIEQGRCHSVYNYLNF